MGASRAGGRVTEPAKHRFGFGRADLLAEIWNRPIDYTAKPGRPPRRTWAGRVLTAATFAATGLLLTLAYQHTVAAAPQAEQNRDDLRADISAQRDDLDVLAGSADELREEVAELRDGLLGDRATVDRLHDSEALTGLRAVTGDGVVVTVADGPDPAAGSDADPAKIFDRDLQLVVNTLWAYGAEAVAIDDQRLTATSSIRSAGEAIMVDFAPVSSPYEVSAVGGDDLAEEFEESATADAFDDYAAEYGISMSVEPVSGLWLPAAAPPVLDNAEAEESD